MIDIEWLREKLKQGTFCVPDYFPYISEGVYVVPSDVFYMIKAHPSFRDQYWRYDNVINGLYGFKMLEKIGIVSCGKYHIEFKNNVVVVTSEGDKQ